MTEPTLPEVDHCWLHYNHVDLWPEECACIHATAGYEARSGVCCRCCMGLLGPRTHVHEFVHLGSAGGIDVLMSRFVLVPASDKGQS